MMEIWITDVSVITALGNSLEDLWQGLIDNKTAIRPITRFPVEGYNADCAAWIEDLTPSGQASMTHILLERLFREMGPVPPDSFLITATTKAGIDNIEKLRRRIVTDTKDTLLSSLAALVSTKLGLAHTGINVSAACASSTIAVARGAALIASGRAESVLICCLDLLTEFIFSGFSCLQAMSPIPCRPFDRNRKGLSVGEGAAALLLMNADRAKREKRTHMGTVLGWGIANDAVHITAPARDGCGLVLAIRSAFDMTTLHEADIAVINAHGTGTVYNDLMELTAFKQVFGPSGVPAHSVKGAIGHTMGAAGGIEVAVGLKTLLKQTVPPTVGFSDTEKGSAGWISSETVDIAGDFLLTTNSGFGGVNAAIILGKGDMI